MTVSFTSSSEQSASSAGDSMESVPLAFLLSLGLVAGIEFSLRALPETWLIAYEQGAAARQTVRHEIMANGVADICFVGSSRTNLGISCPVIRDELERETGTRLAIANYASGGAQVPEIVPLVRMMFRHGRPMMLLMGVDPEQICLKDAVNERSAEFWDIGDFFEARSRFGSQVDRYFPQVLRNGCEQYVFLLRLRGRPGNLLREIAGARTSQHPVKGDYLHPAHTTNAGASLVVTQGLRADVERHVQEDHLHDGSYPFSTQRLELLEDMIQLCESTNVPLVFFELPNAEVFQSQFPEDTREKFVLAFRSLELRHPMIRFMSVEDLDLVFTDADFADPVHLNFLGASKVCRSLVQKSIKGNLVSP